MVDLIAGNISTLTSIGVNSSVYDTIETKGDTDWYKVTLTAGGRYHINMVGDPLFRTALDDSFLRIYDSAGNQLRRDDDNGASVYSYIDFTAPSTGTYYISAGGYDIPSSTIAHTGDYILSVLQDDVPDAFNDFAMRILNPGGSVTGYANTNIEWDRYPVYLRAGDAYTFKMEQAPGGSNSQSDSLEPLTDGILYLRDPNEYFMKSAVGVSGMTLTYTPPTSGWYQISITPNADTAGHYSISLSASPTERNDRPSGTDETVTLAEDTSIDPRTFTYSDPDGDSYYGIIITSLPQSGVLTNYGVPVGVGQFVSLYEEELRYTPAANANGNGIASFTYEVREVTPSTGRRSAIDQTPNTITFNVTPVNDAPVIVSGGGAEATAVEAHENNVTVTTVVAKDVESPVAYAISGADAGLFNINSVTGVVTFKSLPDFEAPWDAGGNNVYDITLLATDGALTDAQALQIYLRNAVGNTIAGTKKDNTVDSTHAIDSKAATGEEDYIDGKKGNDKLNGLGGHDTLIGGAGRDTLTGGPGNDRLDGGKDADRFVFSAKLDVAGVDTIVKFEPGNDKLALDDKVFKAIGSSLSADEFHAKAGAVKAHDKSDHIVYNTTTGNVYYDKDGKGGTAPVLVATLANHPAGLDYHDFLIV